MGSDTLSRYIARGPVTIGGRDWRSGESFVATEEQVSAALACGLAEGWPAAPEETPAPAPSAKPGRR